MFSNVRSSSSQENLIEFKAGRCKLEPGSGHSKRNVVAEKEKGLLFIKQSSDNLMHFCWKNRETGALVDDLIIFPGDTEFKEVKGCQDGQVYMLKFNSSQDCRLFWVQEHTLDGDIVRKVNDILNKPPQLRTTPGRERNTTGGGLSTVNASDTGFQDLGTLGGLDQNQLMQLLQFMSPTGSAEPQLPLAPNRPSQESDQQDGNEASQAANPSPEGQNEDETEVKENPHSPKEPKPKRGKPDDDMELD